MSTYVQPQDVRDAYESDMDQRFTTTWLAKQIDRAERLLTSRRPALASWVDAGTVDVENVKDAVVNAVLRVVRNPEGLQSESEGNYSYSTNRDVAGGKLYFTGDDLALVTPTSPPAAGMVTIGMPDYRLPGRRP
ncbi:Gp19/Gp15/Gp42 family protein [Thalassiella azotivora]